MNQSLTNKLGRSYHRGRPLPLELRAQVIQMLQEGKTAQEISSELKIASVTVNRWNSKFQRTGSYEPTNRGSFDGIKLETETDDSNGAYADENGGQMESMDEDNQAATSSSQDKHYGNGSAAGSQATNNSSSRSASRLSQLRRLRLKRAANQKTIQKLKQKASLVVSKRRQRKRLNAGSGGATKPTLHQNGYASASTAAITGQRSIRNVELPKANLSPKAHSEVRLRESPLSPPPPSIPCRMRRLDVPVSDHHYPITLVINPPAIVMGQHAPPADVEPTTSSAASTSSSSATVPTYSAPSVYPSKVIIEIRYA